MSETQNTRSPCLRNDEIATYEVKKRKRNMGDTEADVIISIRDKNNGLIKNSFQINDLFNDHSFEVHKCGVYVLRMFNYNPEKTKQEPGYKDELWRYDYNGKGEPLLLFAEKPKEFIAYYDPVFRVSPDEIYIVLVRGGYLERPDYALVIRNLNLKTDDFVLPRQFLLEQHPEFIGLFSLRTWTKDGSFFWADLSTTANVEAFLRILRNSWKVDVLFAPEDVLGGDALNLEKGLITVHPGNVWYGIDVMTEQEKERRRAQGIGTELYIQDLFTGKRYFIDKTDEPLWFFKPQWFSDTELEYKLPTGEKKIYNIENKNK